MERVMSALDIAVIAVLVTLFFLFLCVAECIEKAVADWWHE